MKTYIAAPFLILLFVYCSGDSGKDANPLEELPPYITLLTESGERAAWSPDGKKIAFIKKSFSDAFEINIETKETVNLTASSPCHAFLRIQYLPDGNFLLIGPEVFKNIEVSRSKEAELWWMPGDGSGPPVKLNEKINEGVAISRNENIISWAVEGEGIYTAYVTVREGNPLITEKKLIKGPPEDGFEEPQDFRHYDGELIYSHYKGDGTSDVMGLNLSTEAVFNYTPLYEGYDEPEGIFPDEGYICVESDRSGKGEGSQYIDIWKLRIDGSEDVERLTNFTEYSGYKASNPVISPDGSTMAFQIARIGDPAGYGRGILLYRFETEREQ